MFPESLYLRRVDMEHNMRRFYRIRIECNLFGEWELVREWGRIGSKGREKREPYPSAGAALDALAKLAKTKRRRGYAEV